MKYSLSIKILHWFIAALILSLIVLGYFMTPFDKDNPQFSEGLYFWHKSFGVLVLILMCYRLTIRMRSAIPEPPADLPQHEVLASHFAHKLLYFLGIAVPVFGYIQSSSYEFSSGVHFFLIDLPELIPDSKLLFELSNIVHQILAYSLLALICLHVAGVIKHRFFDKEENDVLKRML